MAERLFRYSQTSDFLQSRRKYMLKYIYNLERIYRNEGTRPALASDIGTIGHTGLEAHYKGRRPEVAQRAMRFKANSLRIHDSEKHRVAHAYEAVDRYLHWLDQYAPDKGFTVVDVEKRLFLPMGEFHGDTLTLTVEPDLIVRDNYGLLHVIDHKFVERFTNLASFVGTNRQGLTYSMVCEAEYGQPVTSFTLNQIRRNPPKTQGFLPVERVTQWNTPTALTQHRTYLDRLFADMVKLHQEVEAGDESGAYPNPDFMCVKACPYFAVCCEAITKQPRIVADEIGMNYRKREDDL